MDDGRSKRGRKKARRFIELRRALYLETLRRTGNHRAAARAAGIDPTTAQQRRKRDADFALACLAAEEEAARRLAGAKHMFDGVEDARFETIRRGRNGRLQIVATRTGKWNKTMEEDYFDVLRATANLAAAARAVGVSESLIWQRRRAWPGFRARMEETLEEAEAAMEFRLAAHGTNVGVGQNGDTQNGDTHLCVPSGTQRCVSPPLSCVPERTRRCVSPPFDPGVRAALPQVARGETTRGRAAWTVAAGAGHCGGDGGDRPQGRSDQAAPGQRRAAGWGQSIDCPLPTPSRHSRS